jgi:hypothetical protein
MARLGGGGVEGAVLGALQELGRLFGEKRVMNAAGQVLQTAAQTKAAVDDNVATVLGLAGLPSRSDIDALRRQLDVVQATLANLSRKLDRLSEEVAEQRVRHAGPEAVIDPHAGRTSHGPRKRRTRPATS